MITLKELTEASQHSIQDFNKNQIEDIYNAIQLEGFQSLQDVRDAEESGQLVECNWIADMKIVSLLENLHYSDDQHIVDLINSTYGFRITLHYLQQDELFILIKGIQ